MPLLKDFPLLQRGMYDIMMDQSISGMYIDENAPVLDWEVEGFTIAEAGLKKLEGKELRDILPATVAEMPGYEDLKGEWSSPALYWFYLPMNDLDQFIADYSGMKPSEYWWAKKLLEEFFDGELRERFQGARPGSTYEKILQQRRTRQ